MSLQNARFRPLGMSTTALQPNGRTPKLVHFLAMGLIAASSALSACSSEASSGGSDDSVHDLARGGKADGLGLGFTLNQGNPSVRLRVRCDQPLGCDGHVDVQVVSSDPCSLLQDVEDPNTGEAIVCGAGMNPVDITVATLNLESLTEGKRSLPLRIETGDGLYFTMSIAGAFAAESGETVSFELVRSPIKDALEVEIAADWKEVDRPDPAAAKLEAFLSTVNGLSFAETGTSYPGYRSYVLDYEQPLDHNDPEAGTFLQKIALHHRDSGAPMVLYTSGYELFTQDYLAELTETLPANQISTEQRFFGDSVPEPLTAESWRYVNIEQAARDHHRIVEALQPFYDGAWISTGHSKGGMTSIYHRRFIPNDVDATVAYVAPISFGAPDPRYEPFLDQIGTDACRNAVRAIQWAALERFSALQPMAQQAAVDAGWSFERFGGHAPSYEYAIRQLDWGFWQRGGLGECSYVESVEEMSDDELFNVLIQRVGYGMPDQSFGDAYHYQAATQLGHQSFSTSVFGDMLRYADAHPDLLPTGTSGEYDPSVMQDIQQWVLEEATEILFVYGQYDPWTGGRFATNPSDRIVDVTVPEADHGATIRMLSEADREMALTALKSWTGQRPTIAPSWKPSNAPLPPRIYHEGLPHPVLAAE